MREFATGHIAISPFFGSTVGLKRGRPVLTSESVTLLADSLYAEAVEDVKSRAALPASTPVLISSLGDISSEADRSACLWGCLFRLSCPDRGQFHKRGNCVNRSLHQKEDTTNGFRTEVNELSITGILCTTSVPFSSVRVHLLSRS
jgi:hypothetical protein